MDLPLIYHPNYIAPLPEGHRFPMPKFRQLYELLLTDGTAKPQQFHTPKHPPLEWLELVHTPEYVKAYCEGTLDSKAQRKIGLPWTSALANRTCIAVGGTILTAQLALTHGLACNTAGGTHHAFPNYGSGFCIFNDLAIAARVLQKLGLIQKVLIVDLDVHQGDGTALIFNDSRKKLDALLRQDDYNTLLVEHRDRLARFGTNYLDLLLSRLGVRLEIVNLADNGRERLMQDLVAIITSFAARLYGQRRAKRKTERIIQELSKDEECN
ncbi:MAG: recombinase family protein [Phormidium sp.]